MPATATCTRTSSSSAATRAAEALTKAVQADLYRAALDLGGTVTGEHGIGVARREWLEIQRGADAVRVMRAIKDGARSARHPEPGPRPLGTPSASSGRGTRTRTVMPVSTP